MLTTPITVRLPIDLKRRLDAYSIATGGSVSAAVVAAVTDLLDDDLDPAVAARMDSALDAMPPR